MCNANDAVCVMIKTPTMKAETSGTYLGCSFNLLIKSVQWSLIASGRACIQTLGAQKRDILQLMLREITLPVLAGFARRNVSRGGSLLPAPRGASRTQHRRWRLLCRRFPLVSGHRTVRRLAAVPASHARRSHDGNQIRIAHSDCRRLRLTSQFSGSFT